MYKKLGVILASFSMNLMAGNSILVKDNADIALTLSQGNYNRILIKNDKIFKARIS